MIEKQKECSLTPVPSPGATPEEWPSDSTGQAGQALRGFFRQDLQDPMDCFLVSSFSRRK